MGLRYISQSFIAAVVLTACNTMPNEAIKANLADPFVSDVIGVSQAQLSPEYWIHPNMDNVLMSQSEIAAFNQNNINNDPALYDLNALPQALSHDALIQRIRSISKIPSAPRMYTNGTPVLQSDFARYEAALNLDAIKERNTVRFALTVKRTSIRSYPTSDLVFSQGASNRDIERFQESGLFPGDAVAVLHESADGKWALIQSYNYIAWAPLDSLAIGQRDDVLTYNTSENFLVITGDKVFTVFNPEVSAVSELQLDMGVRLPLSRPKAMQTNLYGQNPYLSHMVLLPVRNTDGTLDFKHALIRRNKDVHVGYLPYTQANIITQSFKFLGERYGWGHRYNGRDCTGFVSEVYKTFGIKLPRNSGDQGKSEIGSNVRYDKIADSAAKITRLRNGKPGDLIYIPGHVMMLVGQSNDRSGAQPFVIHDITGLGYIGEDGGFYKGTLNGVSLTPILPLHSSSNRSYVDMITTIKTVQ